MTTNNTFTIATEQLIKRMQAGPAIMNGRDLTVWQAAKNYLDQVRTYHEVKDANPAAAKLFRTNSYLAIPLKWVLTNPTIYICDESLRLIWEGQKLNQNARKFYNNDTIRTDSKLAVGEHPLPTKILKDLIFDEAPTDTLENFVRFILNRNIISWTNAYADTKLRLAGFNDSTPDNTNVWARYEAVQIQVNRLNPTYIAKNGHDLNHGKMVKAANKMRQDGFTFEQFKKQFVY